MINANHNIFDTSSNLDGPIIKMFVDDIKIMALNKSNMIARVKSELAAALLMVDIGPINFYLQLKIERDQDKKTIKLLQPDYIDKIFSQFCFKNNNVIVPPVNESAIL